MPVACPAGTVCDKPMPVAYPFQISSDVAAALIKVTAVAELNVAEAPNVTPVAVPITGVIAPAVGLTVNCPSAAEAPLYE